MLTPATSRRLARAAQGDPLTHGIGWRLAVLAAERAGARTWEDLPEKVRKPAQRAEKVTPPKGYEHRQRTRELERRIAESRRRLVAAEAMGDPGLLAYLRALLARRLAALRRHQE